MKRWILSIVLVFLGAISFGQSFYFPCKDSSKTENKLFPCYEDYNPVCGCDGITYRGKCSAENQHALNSSNFIDGPCENFHYVVEPNLVDNVLQLWMYRKKAGYINITIYDVYGHVFFQRALSIAAGKSDRQLNEIAAYDHGLYLIEIVSDGEKMIRKFYKVNNK